MEFAMATYDSVAFFTKWAADWVSVQGYDGTDNLPNTVSTYLKFRMCFCSCATYEHNVSTGAYV
jgi:hypothetical protein